jgi:UTP-glucose-1-phosphate uridylyltransferase
VHRTFQFGSTLNVQRSTFNAQRSTPKPLRVFSSTWGVSIEYREEPKPQGIAQAFLVAESVVGRDSVVLILGDTFGRAFTEFRGGATSEYRDYLRGVVAESADQTCMPAQSRIVPSPRPRNHELRLRWPGLCAGPA